MKIPRIEIFREQRESVRLSEEWIIAATGYLYRKCRYNRASGYRDPETDDGRGGRDAGVIPDAAADRPHRWRWDATAWVPVLPAMQYSRVPLLHDGAPREPPTYGISPTAARAGYRWLFKTHFIRLLRGRSLSRLRDGKPESEAVDVLRSPKRSGSVQVVVYPLITAAVERMWSIRG